MAMLMISVSVITPQKEGEKFSNTQKVYEQIVSEEDMELSELIQFINKPKDLRKE